MIKFRELDLLISHIYIKVLFHGSITASAWTEWSHNTALQHRLSLPPPPRAQNYCVRGLELFAAFLFQDILELYDWNLKGTTAKPQTGSVSQRFIHRQRCPTCVSEKSRIKSSQITAWMLHEDIWLICLLNNNNFIYIAHLKWWFKKCFYRWGKKNKKNRKRKRPDEGDVKTWRQNTI